MFKRLCVADFGHAMCSCHCRLPLLLQILARAKPIPRLFAVSTPSMALLNHFISSAWVHWVMLQCWEGSVWLILDMPCALVTTAGQKFGRIQKDPSRNQDCLQPAHQARNYWTISFHQYGSNEWCYKLCWEGYVLLILDMPCALVTAAGQKFGRIQPEPSQYQDCLQSAHQAWHCWTISFLPLCPLSNITMSIRLCVADFHCIWIIP
jgi:uncharacterized protein YceK